MTSTVFTYDTFHSDNRKGSCKMFLVHPKGEVYVILKLRILLHFVSYSQSTISVLNHGRGGCSIKCIEFHFSVFSSLIFCLRKIGRSSTYTSKINKGAWKNSSFQVSNFQFHASVHFWAGGFLWSFETVYNIQHILHWK